MPPYVTAIELRDVLPTAAKYLSNSLLEEWLYEWEDVVTLRIGTLGVGDRIAKRIIRQGAKSDALFKMYQDQFLEEEPTEARLTLEQTNALLDKYDELTSSESEVDIYENLVENITSLPYWDPLEDFSLTEGSSPSLEA